MSKKGGQNMNIQECDFNGNPDARYNFEGKPLVKRRSKSFNIGYLGSAGRVSIGEGGYYYRKLQGAI